MSDHIWNPITSTQFQKINLVEDLPNLCSFDFIFLRNVLIYFDDNMKEKIVKRLAIKLKKDGFLLLGHSESLLNNQDLSLVQPTVYHTSR